MAYIAVNENGYECIFEDKPRRLRGEWDNTTIDENFVTSNKVYLPIGTIEKLIGRRLTWEDEPVKLKPHINNQAKTTLQFTNFIRKWMKKNLKRV